MSQIAGLKDFKQNIKTSSINGKKVISIHWDEDTKEIVIITEE